MIKPGEPGFNKNFYDFLSKRRASRVEDAGRPLKVKGCNRAALNDLQIVIHYSPEILLSGALGYGLGDFAVPCHAEFRRYFTWHDDRTGARRGRISTPAASTHLVYAAVIKTV